MSDVLVPVFDANQSKILDLVCDSYPEFILDAMKEDECLAELQFKKVDIPLLAEAL